jgi:hypothetical protein
MTEPSFESAEQISVHAGQGHKSGKSFPPKVDEYQIDVPDQHFHNFGVISSRLEVAGLAEIAASREYPRNLLN